MKSALVRLHTAVFLWGFTGVLGRAISLNEAWLVWWRMLITAVSSWILFYFLKRIRQSALLNNTLLSATIRAYIGRVGQPTMEINAHVISGLDPGAIPGGSTKFSRVIGGLSWGRSASTDV